MKAKKKSAKDLVYHQPEGERGREDARRRNYGPLMAIRNKALLGKDVESQEYLLGELVGINEAQAQMLPEAWKKIQRAFVMDWSKDILFPVNSNGSLGVVNYGDFWGMYQALLEPWFGGYEELKKDVDDLLSNKITPQEADIRRKARLGKHGGDRRSDEFQGNNVTLKRGNNPEYLTARIARDRPDIHERLQAGEYPSVRRAAIDAGIVREPTTVEKMQKLWLKMTAKERAAFKQWLTESEN